MQPLRVKRCDRGALELSWPDQTALTQQVEQWLSGLDAQVIARDTGADRCQWQFRWQQSDYILFAEHLAQAIWVESGRVVTGPEDLAALEQEIRREQR